MEHMAPCGQIRIKRIQPLAIRPFGGNARVIHQRVQPAIQFAADFLDRFDGFARVGQINLHMVFLTTTPRAFFRKRMARTGDHPPALGIEILHGCMADATAGTGQQHGFASVILGHFDPRSLLDLNLCTAALKYNHLAQPPATINRE